MATLESIRTPRDLDALSTVELHGLAAQIRALLVENVSRTGGHLGPNLGVVGLTLALHCEFDSPRDRIVFDTGHQSYVHKMLTGRAGGFDRLRSRGGLSGYPARKESPHDLVENSHASTGGVDVLAEPGGTGRDVLLVSVGALAPTCLKTAQRLTEVGWAVTVVDPGWVKPVDVALVALAAEHRLVVTVEDGVRAGGFGSALAQALRDADVDVPLRDFGMPARFLSHGSREELLEESGLTAEQLAAAVEKSCRRLWGEEPLAMQAVDAVVGMGRSVHV